MQRGICFPGSFGLQSFEKYIGGYAFLDFLAFLPHGWAAWGTGRARAVRTESTASRSTKSKKSIFSIVFSDILQARTARKACLFVYFLERGSSKCNGGYAFLDVLACCVLKNVLGDMLF